MIVRQVEAIRGLFDDIAQVVNSIFADYTALWERAFINDLACEGMTGKLGSLIRGLQKR